MFNKKIYLKFMKINLKIDRSRKHMSYLNYSKFAKREDNIYNTSNN
jgi:hypothetical protein